ncbi:MAG: glutamine amidotransferase-related protein [Promethearchaeota archaeon]
MSEKNLIYIIDNYSTNSNNGRITHLQEIFSEKIPNTKVKIIHYSEVSLDLLKSSYGIILTGSKLNVSEFNSNSVLRNNFNMILKLIERANNVPILAICFGLHLSGFVFNAKIQRMNITRVGGEIISLSLKNTDELIPYKQITVGIQHRDYISPNDVNIRKKFEIIATKKLYGYNTIQYMRHLERPIYSVQFHPETDFENYSNKYSEENIKKAEDYGEEIIMNFAKICIEGS